MCVSISICEVDGPNAILQTVVHHFPLPTGELKWKSIGRDASKHLAIGISGWQWFIRSWPSISSWMRDGFCQGRVGEGLVILCRVWHSVYLACQDADWFVFSTCVSRAKVACLIVGAVFQYVKCLVSILGGNSLF